MLLGGCTGDTTPTPITSIDIVDYGILTYERARKDKDPTSSIGAEKSLARQIRIVERTDRIPLRIGITYGVSFVVRGPTPGVATIKVVLRSSNPCILKGTQQVVYENDSILQVGIGELRHIGGRLVSPEEDHCLNPPKSGIYTMALYDGDRKLAEKNFELVSDSPQSPH